jgi:hypothetical protein
VRHRGVVSGSRWTVGDSLRSAVAHRDGDVVTWNPRFVQLRCDYAFSGTACTPATPREKGSVEGPVRHHKSADRSAGARRLRRAVRMTAKTKSAVGERLPYLLSKLKAPRVLERLRQTAARAREEEWPHEQSLETLLQAEVFAHNAPGARQRVRHAAFPAHKTLGGLRLRRAARCREAADPAPRATRVDHRAQQRLLHRRAGYRQDAPFDRPSDQGMPGRAPRRVRDRPAMGRPPRAGATPQRPGRRTQDASSATR